MEDMDIVRKIEQLGIVAVVRAKSAAEALAICKACQKGGIEAIEVTYTVPDAASVIKTLADELNDQILLGAGTILNQHMAEEAIASGAKYIVSPGFDQSTALFCVKMDVPYFPGCLTITEMMQALASGVKMIKLFPGSAFGPTYVKAIKGPLPDIKIMPTGGVSLDNIKEWFKYGVAAVGVGGELTKPAAQGDYDGVTAMAVEFVKAVAEARK
jgi:2-dehydro-3-deoxyphosphogluconate aldolase/(4S)-4-hydroxy-2-oxoglutarate aldolase